MKNKWVISNLSFLGAAIVWGFAFVAQRQGMAFVGPLTFNGIRFLLGAIVLIPAFWLFRPVISNDLPLKSYLFAGFMAGLPLFVASTFQQLGMIYTTAGNGGFITSLYIIFVPVFGFFRKQPSSPSIWLGAGLALSGLYLLSVDSNFQMQTGDILVFISAIFWAMHLIVLSYLSPRFDFRLLAFGQFVFTGILSLVLAFVFETPRLGPIHAAIFPVLYAGIVSIGIGFTLQVIGQKYARADHSALVLSLEAVFAAFAGWLILDENMEWKAMMGCLLMLSGVVLSQLKFRFVR
ncbi:MAG: DMT family transporter [Bacteroidales bacterium]|nr:DMT family transporter [Bacteroidales bacterium]